MDSLSKGKMRRTKIFGAPLEDLPLNCQGMPKIVHRLCCYLEQYGELFSSSISNDKVNDEIKVQLEPTERRHRTGNFFA